MRAPLGIAGVALALAGLLAAATATLAPVLRAGFEFDDRADVVDNPAARPDGFAAALGTTNRPLLKASYALQRAWSGDRPAPFHAVNLALHLADGLLVFLLARRLAGRAGGPASSVAALVAAAIWMLHPAAVEAVAPVVGRSALLSTTALLAAFLAVTGERAPSRRVALAAALLAFAAPLARETALVLPALTLLWQATLGRGEEPRDAIRRQLPIAAGTLFAALAVALSSRHRELVAFSLETRSPLESLRGNLPAIRDLLVLWFRPSLVSVDPAPPADLPWTSPAMLALVAAAVAIGALALVFRRRRPAAVFALGWTVLALLPSNSILWRLDPVAPRALYLASVGLVLALALAVAKALAAASTLDGRAIRAAVPAMLALALSLAAGSLALESRRRAELWTDPARLWADAALKAPARCRPWLNLGVELMIADRLEAAETALDLAARLDPSEDRARCALAAVRVRRAGSDLSERSPGT